MKCDLVENLKEKICFCIEKGEEMKEIKIDENQENQRLDKFLMKYFNTAPKSFIYKMLRKKRIKYNGSKADGNEIIKAGDTLIMYLAEDTMDGFMQEKSIKKAERHFGIVYEDKNILIILKPAGILTHPEKPEDKDSLIDQVLYYLSENGEYDNSKSSSFTPALCNRLDRNTSGIVLAGKNLAAVQEINKAISERKIKKLYFTLVKGKIDKAGSLVGYMTKSSFENQVRISEEDRSGFGKKVVTEYRPVLMNENYTLLEVNLVTGKSHQIRAHFQKMGHPVLGDRKYGDLKLNKMVKEKYGLNNQFLHAYKVIWNNNEGKLSYLNGKEFSAPLPQNLNNLAKDIFGDAMEQIYFL